DSTVAAGQRGQGHPVGPRPAERDVDDRPLRPARQPLVGPMRVHANGARSTGGVRPSSVSATASPIAVACLKPWPEQAETTVTPSNVGCRSTTKRPSGKAV